MARKLEKTTIIFVNKNQRSGKQIQVPAGIARHWKKYVAGIAAIFVFLVATILYLTYSKASVELSNDRLARELQRQRSQPVAEQQEELDTSAIKKYYQSIDRKLTVINRYLKARGIRQIIPNVGGDEEREELSAKAAGELYDAHLDKMIDYVAFTPMGYPHFGRITSGFGHRENPFTGGSAERHKGLDIKGRRGEIVRSTASGRVVAAGRKGGYGNCIVIRHANGFETYYGHLSKIMVRNGQRVSAGDRIGRIGSTGRSTGPHLHYEVHRYGKVINPRSFLVLE